MRHCRDGLAVASDCEFAWATGLFEGEGCILVNPPTAKSRVGMFLTSTDADVVRRFAQIVGHGRARGPIKRPGKPHHKPFWKWELTSASCILEILTRMMPLLGERRRAKATDAVAAARSVRRTVKRRRPTHPVLVSWIEPSRRTTQMVRNRSP